MHETPVIEAILDAAGKEAEKKGLKKVRIIELEIGALSGYLPDSLIKHYEHVLNDHLPKYDKFKKAKLYIKTVPATLKCTKYNLEIKSYSQKIECRKCKGLLAIKNSQEITILDVK